MKRSDLEKFLGKTVEITIFDGDTYSGILHKTGAEHEPRASQAWNRRATSNDSDRNH